MLTQLTKMINSILNRYKEPVHFHNIKTDSDIITDHKQIKQHISDHFNEWTAHHPYNEQIFNQYWQTEYTPNPKINSKWYNPVLEHIDIEEVIQII